MLRYRLLIVNSILLAVLLGSFFGRRLENTQVSRVDFLRPLSLPFRGWKTTDATLSPSDLALLQPDATLVRRYTSPEGEQIELAVIAGHRKQSIHTPGFCMVGGGWEILSQENRTLTIGSTRIAATRSVMTSKGVQVVATYFFTDGSYSTRNLPWFQTIQLAKRFRAEVPIGALVRIITPVRANQIDAERLTDEFAAATLPAVLSAVRSVHLNAR